MDVKGVQGTISFDGEWITITKTPIGPKPAPTRIRAADVTASRCKPGNRLRHGYVQFLVPGSQAIRENGARPHIGDPHSLAIPRSSNDAVTKLVAAVEQARR